MPVLCIDLSFQSQEESKVEEYKIVLQEKDNKKYIELRKDCQYTLIVGVKRKNYSQTQLRAHCPRFHRAKDEGWFLVLGDVEARELLALKRVSGINGPGKVHYLQFTTPSRSGKLTFFFLYT